MFMEKQCQSCGMPLTTNEAGDCRGTEADGSRSDEWCSLCYQDGAWTNPQLTAEQMVKIVDDALTKDGRSAGMRYLARKQVPHLRRWRDAA